MTKDNQDQTIVIGNFRFVIFKIVAFKLPQEMSKKFYIEVYCAGDTEPFNVYYNTKAEAMSDYHKLQVEIDCYYN